MESLTPEVTDVINSIQNLSGTNRPYRAVKLPWDESVYGSFVLPEKYTQFMQPRELHAESVLKTNSQFYELMDEGLLTDKLTSGGLTADIRNNLGQYAGKHSLKPVEGLTFTSTISLPPPTAPAAVAVAACLLAKYIDVHVRNIQNALDVIYNFLIDEKFADLKGEADTLVRKLEAVKREPYHKDENRSLLITTDTICTHASQAIDLCKRVLHRNEAKPSYDIFAACFDIWRFAIENYCQAIILHAIVSEEPNCTELEQGIKFSKGYCRSYKICLKRAENILTELAIKQRKKKALKNAALIISGASALCVGITTLPISDKGKNTALGTLKTVLKAKQSFDHYSYHKQDDGKLAKALEQDCKFVTAPYTQAMERLLALYQRKGFVVKYKDNVYYLTPREVTPQKQSPHPQSHP